MLSDPVARMTSPAVTSEAAPPRDISTDETYPQQTMRVEKRNGSADPVDVTKIVRAVKRCCIGLSDIEPLRIAAKTISGFYNGATTRELDQLSIQTAAALVEEPQYAKLAARLRALSNGVSDDMGCRDRTGMGHYTEVVTARGLSQ
jgi:ribonucleoside-diphosphate reductase alpha chain